MERGRHRYRRAAWPLAACALTILIAAVAAFARPGDPHWTVASPDDAITATVTAHAGVYTLSVTRRGVGVLQTPLGTGDAGGLRTRTDTIDEAYATPAGKRRRHVLSARRLTMSFPHGRRVEVLVADDGAAVRQTGAGKDPTAWRAAAGARAWLQGYRADYEGHYNGTALRDARAGVYGMPALLQAGKDTWALLTESGLTREAAARLEILRTRPGVLNVTLPEGESPPRTTPWRVAVIGDLATIVESDLPLSLGRPSQIRDTAWIHPGRAAWSWWSDQDSPGDLSRQRAFVRAAAAHQWEYVLLDAGWDARTVPALAAYAARNGVRLVLWTDWHALEDPKQRDRLLGQWASWGVGGVKVDFLLSDSAARMAIYDDIASDAAAHHLVVDFHGCTIPRGIQRTWPNVLTMEAVEGAEREIPAQGAKAMDPRHDVNLAFTRNPIGAMDYTPVTFSARNRDTTDGHRLAQAVVYESGLQHFADSPESYGQRPLADQLLASVPSTWDDTRLLAGAPDREAMIGRRAGDAWWLGSISATGAHRQTITLTFLDPGRSYQLHLVRDDGQGGLATEDRTVTHDDRLSVAVDRNGGFVAELTPQR
jgi:alpha-glucosidase